MTQRSVTLRAPGKLNLVLDVLAKRDDGYHEIRSVMVAVGLYDTLRIADAPAGTLEIRCDSPLAPSDRSNLVAKAAELVNRRLGGARGCRIELEKRIPVGGGMGGGSSDAAAALQGLNTLWNAGISPPELVEMAAQLGSDVPFFLKGGSAIVTGRGERVEPMDLLWTGYAALASAGVVVSTREVYGRCTVRADRADGNAACEALRTACTAGQMRRLLRNDLAPAVFASAPQVARLRDELEHAGGESVCLTGAGAVLFVLFDERPGAATWCDRVRSAGISADLAVAAAPVQGSRVEEC